MIILYIKMLLHPAGHETKSSLSLLSLLLCRGDKPELPILLIAVLCSTSARSKYTSGSFKLFNIQLYLQIMSHVNVCLHAIILGDVRVKLISIVQVGAPPKFKEARASAKV